jgi:putative endopeptidase
VQSDLDRIQQIIDTELMTIIAQPNDIVPNMYVFYNSLRYAAAHDNTEDLRYVFSAINAINSLDSMALVMAALIQYDVGFIAMRTLPMITNSKHLSLNLQQNVLTLGSESLYLDPQYSQVRSKYATFIDATYSLLCADLKITPIKKFSSKVILFETILATNYMKDSLNVDNTKLVSVNDLNSKNDLWSRIFAALNISCQYVYTDNVKYLGIINVLVSKINTPIYKYYKCYLMWSFFIDCIGYMNESYQRMYYDFSLILDAKTTAFDLDKSIYSTITAIMCAQVGYVYVDKIFLRDHGPSVIDAVSMLAHNIVVSCIDILENSHWLSSNTRQYAIEKIKRIRFHIGYSSCMDRMNDIQLTDTNALRNSLIIQKYAFNKYVIAKIDSDRTAYLKCADAIYPITSNDDEDWDIQYAGLGYQMINAFYDQYQNSVYILAGIINKPMFDPLQPQAINYGALGAIIGHEIIHAIDIEGSKYDIDGNLNNWWNAADRKSFEFEANKISQHYTSLGSIKSSQTLPEDMADIGGLKIALNAYLKFVEPNLVGSNNETRKLFFSAWAKLWCHKDDENILGNLSDVHADSSLRINGPMSHIDAFYDIFDVKPQDKMYIDTNLRTKFMS